MTYRVLGLLVGASLMAASLSACGHVPPEPVPKINAHPQQAYRVQLHTEDAPGGFDAVTGEVLYKVEQPKCLAWKERFAGVTMQAEHRHPFALRRVDATTYEGVFYADLLIDEDYYQLGVCHWSVNAVSVDLMKGHTQFDTYVANHGQWDRPSSSGHQFLLKDYQDAAAGQGPQYADSAPEQLPFNRPHFTLRLDAMPLGGPQVQPIP